MEDVAEAVVSEAVEDVTEAVEPEAGDVEPPNAAEEAVEPEADDAELPSDAAEAGKPKAGDAEPPSDAAEPDPGSAPEPEPNSQPGMEPGTEPETELSGAAPSAEPSAEYSAVPAGSSPTVKGQSPSSKKLQHSPLASDVNSSTVARVASRRLVISHSASSIRSHQSVSSHQSFATSPASEHLVAAVSAERQARERLQRLRARVQRELRKSSSQSAMETIRERNRNAGKEAREDFDRRIGRDLTRQLDNDDVQPADDDEYRKISEMFNRLLLKREPKEQSFWVLFKQMDIDGSRRISFKEFERSLRDGLHLSQSKFPHSRMLSLWRRLDADGSGYVDAGELGRFIKIGRPEQGLGARVRLAMHKKVDRKVHLEDLDKRAGRDVTEYIRTNDVPPVSDEELHSLSALFNSRMNTLKPSDAPCASALQGPNAASTRH